MGFGMDTKRKGRSREGFMVGRLKTTKNDTKHRSGWKRSRDNGNGRKLKYDVGDESYNEINVNLSSHTSKYASSFGAKRFASKVGNRGKFRNTDAEIQFRSEQLRSKDVPASNTESVPGDENISRPKAARDDRGPSVKKFTHAQQYRRNEAEQADDSEESDTEVYSRDSKSKIQRIIQRKYVKKIIDNAEDISFRKKSNKNQKTEQIQPTNQRSQKHSLSNNPVKREDHRKSPSKESLKADEKPKRKKRVIRLDPNDISNKRIVDSIPTLTPTPIPIPIPTPTEEKTEEKENELSSNAQFRAIKPSPAILSFVENNLLGRRRTIELKRAGYNIDFSAPLDNVPFSTFTDRERIEESVFRNKLEFFAAAKVSTSFPPPVLPEIAFAGRSNVGKSSLLNALTRQWGIVRTSDKPGHTQTINFFRLASKLCMVDLPGYGFAYAKEDVKDAWEELVKEYVSTREGLERVCLLIDTKWGMKQRDHELIDLMERSRTPYQIVLTKTDVTFPMDVARRAMQIQEDLKAKKSLVRPLMMVSSKSGAGIRNLRTVLGKLARFIKP